MGYISDVVIAIEFEERVNLVSFVAFMRMNTTPAMQEVLDDMVSIPETNIVALINEGIKWYDSYDYTQAAEHIHQMARERGASTMRIVIGEEYDDVSYQVNTYEYSTLDQHFDLVRYIKFPTNLVPLRKSLTTVE
jgi:hypothetical protein